VALSVGTRLGRYEVLSPLGAGGMGEVYRARDTRLGRDVALKILPEDRSSDPDRLRRFESEARAVASLNHPHILALHDVGTHDGVPYAVMELLEGRTLRRALERGPLPARKVVDYGVQICRGLAAAHERGVVHRDLKPENLFVSKDGQVKILDFGLAKLTGPVEAGDTVDSRGPTATEPGMVMGTAGYMSPEQARGRPADARSDLFSLGAILYEMLSGRRAFSGDTPADTLSAILNDDPNEIQPGSGAIPPGLESVVRRCLEKSPEERFQSPRDLAFALETLSTASGAMAGDRTRSTSARWLRRLGWAGALAVIAGLAALWMSTVRDPPRPPLRVRPITSEPGEELFPALSPDGNLVAYFRRSGDLYVKQIDGGEPLLVGPAVEATRPWSRSPAWSPDGRQIAFLRRSEDADGKAISEVLVVPALGGPEGRVTTRAPGTPNGLSWSPDGRSLAFADRDSAGESASIVLYSLETGERRKVTQPPAGAPGDFMPRFSPDGRTLAFVRSVAPVEGDLYLVPAEGGEERRLTELGRFMLGLDWAADGGSIIFAPGRLLWRVPVSGGEPELLEFSDSGSMPTISRRGGRLAYIRNETDIDVCRAGGPAAREEERAATRLVSSTQTDLHARYSPDGTQIVFSSTRSGAREIWICDSDGSNPRQLTFLDAGVSAGPSWSPDGRQIAFGGEGGAFHVFVVDASGGVPRRLTSGSSAFPWSWSHDGRWIYFSSNRTGREEVWKMSPEGGEALQVTTQGGAAAIESSDGRFLYFGKKDPLGKGPRGIWRIPVDGGEEVQVLDRAGGYLWTLLDEGILYADIDYDRHRLELFDLARGEVTWTANLDVPVSASILSPSPDGRFVLYSGAGRAEADIVLVENFE
jgi:Tol biopolymer transport system component